MGLDDSELPTWVEMTKAINLCRQYLQAHKYQLRGTTITAVDLFHYMACYGRENCPLNREGPRMLTATSFSPLAGHDAKSAAKMARHLRRWAPES